MRKTLVATLCVLLTIAGLSLDLRAKSGTETISKVRLKNTEPKPVATMKHKGPFNEIPAIIGRLKKDIEQGGYYMTGPVMAVFYNSPEQVSEKELLWEIRIPVTYPGRIVPVENDQMGFRYMDSRFVAYTFHIGPYETLNETYKSLFGWVDQQKYNVKGFPIELYWSNPEVTPKEKLVTEIWLPVEEKKTPRTHIR